MKEIPVLFSTPMVQANLEGRKTNTRRLKGLEKINQDPASYNLQTLFLHATGRFTFAPVDPMHAITEADIIEVKCPYGQPGDLLWVREAFSLWLDAIKYKADGESVLKGFKYKPSIHMPKDYARIWLQVEEIRVERLQDISEEDAIAEGAMMVTFTDGDISPSTAFRFLWKLINGEESWNANPWVWVVKYKILSTTGKPQICYKTNEVCKYDCKGLCLESM